jgi:hypothetical protein
MSSEEIYPAVELLTPPHRAKNEQFLRDKQAFWAMRTELLQRYEGQYVAIYQGKVVDNDQDKVALALRVYQTYGYVPIFVHQVSRQKPVTRFIRSPHLPAQH